MIFQKENSNFQSVRAFYRLQYHIGQFDKMCHYSIISVIVYETKLHLFHTVPIPPVSECLHCCVALLPRAAAAVDLCSSCASGCRSRSSCRACDRSPICQIYIVVQHVVGRCCIKMIARFEFWSFECNNNCHFPCVTWSSSCTVPATLSAARSRTGTWRPQWSPCWDWTSAESMTYLQMLWNAFSLYPDQISLFIEIVLFFEIFPFPQFIFSQSVAQQWGAICRCLSLSRRRPRYVAKLWRCVSSAILSSFGGKYAEPAHSITKPVSNTISTFRHEISLTTSMEQLPCPAACVPQEIFPFARVGKKVQYDKSGVPHPFSSLVSFTKRANLLVWKVVTVPTFCLASFWCRNLPRPR